MHLNYGNQGFYRSLGIEPSCGICEHFQAVHGGGPDTMEGLCRHPEKPKGSVVKRGCCFNFERAPGADDT